MDAKERLQAESEAVDELLAETPRELLDILLDLARATLNLETAQDTMTPEEWELVVDELHKRKKIGSVADLARHEAPKLGQCKICGASSNSLVSWEDLHHYVVPEQPTLHVITNANEAQFRECEKMWENGTERNLDDWLHEAGYVALVCGE